MGARIAVDNQIIIGLKQTKRKKRIPWRKDGEVRELGRREEGGGKGREEETGGSRVALARAGGFWPATHTHINALKNKTKPYFPNSIQLNSIQVKSSQVKVEPS
jgi:hypothetical protein